MNTKLVNARLVFVTSLLAVICIWAGSSITTQVQSEFNTESASVVEVSSMPTNGFFWSISGKFPPAPFDPLPQLALYT
jgi:hypothetical protein